MKKKLIFVTKALWIGGIETALTNLLRAFDYTRYDVTLLVLHAELDMADRLPPEVRLLVADRDKTVTFGRAYPYSRLYHLTEEAASPSALHRALQWTVPAIRWIENRLYIRYIRALMRGERFDTAVIYSDVAAETALRSIRAGRWLMFYHHGAMRHVYHDAIAYRKCDKIIAVSQNLADALRQFVPEYADKVTAIHNLCDVDGVLVRAGAPCAHTFAPDEFHIVTVGRVSPEKGIDLAAEACAALVRGGMENLRWWIVGDGPAMDAVKRRIADLHLEEHMMLTGMQNNPYPYIAQADLYVQPSRTEAFGLTIAEALILGKPVVATDTLGAREVLGDDGELCHPTAAELCSAVKKAMKNAGSSNKSHRTTDFARKNAESLQELEQYL